MDKLNFTIAKKLTELRKQSKLTQAELAEKLNYSDKAVSKWEKGDSVPTIEVLYKLSELYGVSIDYIVGREEKTPEKNTAKVKKKRRMIIAMLSILIVWFVSIVIHTVFKLTIDIDLWIVFCWALPASVVVALVFDSVWNRSKLLFFFISVLIWSVLICLALQFFNYNIWRILLIGIPMQIATFLWAKLVK